VLGERFLKCKFIGLDGRSVATKQTWNAWETVEEVGPVIRSGKCEQSAIGRYIR